MPLVESCINSPELLHALLVDRGGPQEKDHIDLQLETFDSMGMVRAKGYGQSTNSGFTASLQKYY